ncbi:MAG: hypothetical protein AUJ71_01255 [Candidatus Omnitrophica bacterium CG1_02_49_16]|nr:MAG: hypothetical protein AUJ71_01255 [Candidatus Omnitrophica bacterium CG1_02_49_16]
MAKIETVFRSFLLNNGFVKIDGGWLVPEALLRRRAVREYMESYSACDAERGFVSDFFIGCFIESIAVDGRVCLAEASLIPCLVMEGDWGGQTYLTAPARLIGANANLGQLLKELNDFAWDCNADAAELNGSDGSDMYLNYMMELAGGKPLGIWINEKFHPEHKCRPADHWHSISIPELAPPDFNPETQCPPQVEFTCEEVHRMKWGERVQYYLDLTNKSKMPLEKLQALCGGA